MMVVLRVLLYFGSVATSFFSSLAFAGTALPNTYIAGVYQDYTGDRENSLVGAEGYGLTVISTPHKSHFRLIYGAMLTFGDGRGYVAGTRYAMSAYSADAIVGLSIYPIVDKVAVRPFLEMAGVGGIKYLEVTSPPAGVNGESTGLSYGYRLAIGLEAHLSYRYGFRMSADYINNRSNLVNASPFQFDSFVLTMGLFF